MGRHFEFVKDPTAFSKVSTLGQCRHIRGADSLTHLSGCPRQLIHLRYSLDNRQALNCPSLPTAFSRTMAS